MNKLANAVIQELKTEPLLLALVVTNLVWVGLTTFMAYNQMNRIGTLVKFIAEHCAVK
jgi:hypothetical protein